MSRLLLLLVFTVSVLAVGVALSQDYPTPEQLHAALQDLAAQNPDLLTLETIARSREGRAVAAVTLARAGKTPPASRQAVLVAAGLEATLLHTSFVALAMLREVTRRKGEPELRALLESHVVYLVPQANPDGASRCFAKPRRENPFNSVPRDEDRDSRVDEDGPDDIDLDGEILQMRVPDPEGPLVVDGADPRLLRSYSPADAGSARFRVIEEGADSDGDGVLNEDPPGGVDVAANFPHELEARAAGSGPYAASEPESKALIDFLLAHPNIQAVLTYGAHDNVINPPPPRDGPPEKRGEHRLWKKDAELHAELARRYRELTGLKAKPQDDSPRGAWHETAYFTLGVPSFAACLFGGEPPGAATEPSLEKRWLDWNDASLKGSGFVPWRPFAHPQLGTVHIGGWRPLVRRNPAPAEAAALAPAQVRFLESLAGVLPRVEVESVRVTELESGLFEVRARVTNRGEWPTAWVQGVHTSRRAPLNVEVSGEGLKFVGDDARRIIDSLDGRGGSRELTWVVLGPRGGAIAVNVRARGQPLASRKMELSPGGSL